MIFEAVRLSGQPANDAPLVAAASNGLVECVTDARDFVVRTGIAVEIQTRQTGALENVVRITPGGEDWSEDWTPID